MTHTFCIIKSDGTKEFVQLRDRNQHPYTNPTQNIHTLSLTADRVVWIEQRRYIKNRFGSLTDPIDKDFQ